jgi:hypothetical protein
VYVAVHHVINCIINATKLVMLVVEDTKSNKEQ